MGCRQVRSSTFLSDKLCQNFGKTKKNRNGRNHKTKLRLRIERMK